MKSIRSGLAAALIAAGLLAAMPAQAQSPTKANAASQVPAGVDAALRKNLAQRIPAFARIDEIRRTPVAGLYEVRVGTDFFYADAEGEYLIEGQMLDTRARQNLTQQRIDQLTAINFDALPTKDGFVIVRGNGKRKLAVFEDPHCPYCKQFEKELQKVDNVTVYMYLYPILGPRSVEASKDIWCSRDRAKTWQDWMVRGEGAPKADASCDVTAMERNVEFGKKHNLTGTPTLLFVNGKRVPGAISAVDVEKLLASK